MGEYVKAMPDLGTLISDVNPEVVWHDPFSHGYTLVTLTRENARADYRTVSTIYAPVYTASTVASYAAGIDKGGVTQLSPV